MLSDETWQGPIELSMRPDARQLRFASFDFMYPQTYHVPKRTRFSLFVLSEASSPPPLSIATIAKTGSKIGGRARLASGQSQPCLLYKSACTGAFFAGKSWVSDAWARTMLLGAFLNSSSWPVVSPGTMSPLRPLLELYLPSIFLIYISRSA